MAPTRLGLSNYNGFLRPTTQIEAESEADRVPLIITVSGYGSDYCNVHKSAILSYLGDNAS